MSDPTTTNLVLAQPSRGSDSGTWDTPVNNNTGVLDACFGSVTTTSLTNANVSLTATQSQVSLLRFTGTLSGNVAITLGAIVKSWIFENLTTGAFTITIKGSPGTGNVIALPPGSCQAYWDGTNVAFLNLGRVAEYWDYAGTGVPAWVTACTVPPYLNCNGGTFSAVTYPLLNQILGGTTLPDSKGRLRATLDQSAGRITTAGSSIDGTTLSAAGGAQNVALVQGNLPSGALAGSSATLKYTNIGITVTAGASPVIQATGSGGSVTDTTGITSLNLGGSGTAVNKMPPTYIGGITMIRAA